MWITTTPFQAIVTFLYILLLLSPEKSILVVKSVNVALNDDVLGLMVFKADIQDPYFKLSSWKEEDDSPCKWVGVRCDKFSGRVTELHLPGLSLSGHVSKGLLRLQFLQSLSLSRNNFTGYINNPVLTQLIKSLQYINLGENGFYGSIPEEWFRQCWSIRFISLSSNKLTGHIPKSIGSCLTLQDVDFKSNMLSGELPKNIWSLTSLRSIDLSNNFLDGEIPNEKIETLFDLRVFNLSCNNFSGELPEKIGECLLLKSVDVSDNYLVGKIPLSLQKLSLCNVVCLKGNYFAGEIPEWIGNMKSLERLDFSVNNFTGLVPSALGDLESLKSLNLSLNQFTGNLPESLVNCINLSVIDVSRNMFTGNIPSWVFSLRLKSVLLSGNQFRGNVEFGESAAAFESLEMLDLSSNSFYGTIPLSVGNFSNLELLNLSGNSFSGFVPASLGGLKDVSVVDLSHNLLNGSIPNEIGGAGSLQELRLENNFFTGSIPNEIQNCPFLSILSLSRNNISGIIPVGIANLTYLEYVDLSFNHLSGSLPKELTNLSNLTTFNVSHNDLEGELPLGGFFNTIPLSSVFDNPSICGSIVNQSCPGAHPKPIVLNPNPSHSDHGSESLNMSHKGIILSISAIIAIGAAVLIALGVIVVTILNLHVKNSMSRSAAVALTFSGGDDFSHTRSPSSDYGKLVMFTGDAEFASGTHALLNKECELGRGGFGVVYWTALRNGRSVAIKKLNPNLIKSQEDFDREVKKLGLIRHSNLVLLEGYYWTPSLQLLINEYVSSGSLYKHIHEGNSENTLSWRERFEIILGTAKGLAHLHQMKVIHYNIKSANVLIDCSGEAKVGDFGLAALLPSLDRHVLSSKIQSALGYMAPEFACQTVKITEKCDVYGFGILMLEIVTGKKPVEYMEDDVVILCDMVRGALDNGRADECIDRKLNGDFPVEEGISVIKLGLVCASQVPSNRPDMEEVIKILEMIQCPSEAREEIE
ncbi:leucine-rich repeat receptor-like protein kinase PXC2 [Rutidosis leptorrhynchoides]|uniref:leucine-rich repeat receptor-like protein kinase PXC2 n=1 Tax=Rutidosis leptorrhynchoides TaxID=125765 RepID=UPI003A99BC41